MAFVEVAANTLDDAYEIENSLRFNSSDSPKLQLTTGSNGDREKFTFSCWFKVCQDMGADQTLISWNDGTHEPHIKIDTTNEQINFRISDSNSDNVMTNMMFRDYSAWYHLVVAMDTSQSTAANRVKIYVNGTQQTSLATTDYVNQNTTTTIMSNTEITIGRDVTNDNKPFDGYIAEIFVVDGTAYAASDFGKTDDNGVWVPIDAKPNITFGTHGFYMEFKQTGTGTDANGIGADTSGNDNHYAVTNLAAIDVTTDTPTNNFAILNRNTARTHPELREGNLSQHEHGSTNSAGAAATIMPINGKWYCELFLNGPSAGDYPMLGITDTINLNQQGAQGTKMAAGFEIDGVTNNQSTTNLGTITNTNTGWPTFADNDIVMFALDCDNRKLWIGRQGTWINSGDPAGESNHQLSWTISDNVCPFLLGYDNSQSGGGGDESIWNYGNPPFAISSSNADANGYGSFEYGVPSGFYALCTKNLAEFG